MEVLDLGADPESWEEGTRLGMEVALGDGQHDLFGLLYGTTYLLGQVYNIVIDLEELLLGEDIHQLEDNLDPVLVALRTVDSCVEGDGPWKTPKVPHSPVEP